MDYARLGEADAILICVPTPLTRQREPDLSYVVKTVEAILPTLRPGQVIALESTTYPGTTREVMKPILEKSGLVAGKDFFLAYSPEREDPGNKHFNTANIPKVVGGDGPDACRLAEALYGHMVDNIVMVSSVEAAEATKLTENIFRAVNIALVNELKVVYEAMGIDIWEVIEAAKSKPFGYMPFYPGPGLGGHCIPIDPFYLTWKAREYDISTKFIELAGEINTAMPRRVVERLSHALNDRFRKSLNGSRILLMGVAYKKNIDDQRESPAFKILDYLEEQGAQTAFYDPFLSTILPSREHAAYTGRQSVDFDPTVLKGFDAAIIVTDHDGVDYQMLVDCLPLVVDTRNAIARAGIVADNVTKA
jgi:UDP-N-acetyl-D-glucosamine dehydrogenase